MIRSKQDIIEFAARILTTKSFTAKDLGYDSFGNMPGDNSPLDDRAIVVRESRRALIAQALLHYADSLRD